jgi:hypothetical protein
MNELSSLFKNARFQVASMLIVGIAIGAVGTWFVAEQAGYLKERSAAPNIQVTPTVVNADVEDGSKDTDLNGASLEVNWLAEAKPLSKMDALQIFAASNPTKSSVEISRALSASWKDELNDESSYQFSYVEGIWNMGTVRTEMYKGDEVYLVELSVLDLGFPSRYQYMIKSSKTGALYFDVSLMDIEAEKIMEGYEDFMSLVKSSEFFVQTTAPANTLVINGFKYFTMGNDLWSGASYRFEMDPMKEVARASDGTVVWEYANDTNRLGCLYAFASDGKSYRYGSNMEESETWDGMSQTPVKPSVAWKKEYENTEAFIGTEYGGCGTSGCVSLISETDANVAGGIVSVGKTSRGADVYIPVNIAEHPLTKTIYEGWYVPNGEKKPSMSEFLKQHPVPFFFWKDSIGRLTVYRSDSVLPMAECGKPVIYLYPEKETDVRVALPSSIDVTVSEPTYPENGWNVTASPNGDLVSHADGKTYGSLYWEGTGVSYQPPTTGFVVAKEQVSSFLTSTLPKYGLNAKESSDFMEFWVPRMTNSAYYQISFLTDDWSKAAPLSVLPRPDTSIRIFMDLKPLSAPISIVEPTIVTPIRNGFTLVEWGGLLLKSQ